MDFPHITLCHEDPSLTPTRKRKVPVPNSFMATWGLSPNSSCFIGFVDSTVPGQFIKAFRSVASFPAPLPCLWVPCVSADKTSPWKASLLVLCFELHLGSVGVWFYQYKGSQETFRTSQTRGKVKKRGKASSSLVLTVPYQITMNCSENGVWHDLENRKWLQFGRGGGREKKEDQCWVVMARRYPCSWAPSQCFHFRFLRPWF